MRPAWRMLPLDVGMYRAIRVFAHLPLADDREVGVHREAV